MEAHAETHRAMSREAPIAVLGATALASVLMVYDHLIGNQPGSTDSFPVDPGGFLLSIVVIAVFALVVLGRVVPRALGDAARETKYALALSSVAVVAAPFGIWLGFPLVLAGGGIGLGLHARRNAGGRWAIAAVVLGAVVLLFGALATMFPGETD
jgi:hypothetical protein